MRGTPTAKRRRRRNRGIIPAYAGNTNGTNYFYVKNRDHPRVCGEHQRDQLLLREKPGSSPRMRGTLIRDRSRNHSTGIIPAYAGNTDRRTRNCRIRWDHPRVCGEHSGCSISRLYARGSSPRMRGTHAHLLAQKTGKGIIPAYAGNTRSTEAGACPWWDHPRVCGEHRLAESIASGLEGSSPRMRGTRTPRETRYRAVGIIPAYAGNTER